MCVDGITAQEREITFEKILKCKFWKDEELRNKEIVLTYSVEQKLRILVQYLKTWKKPNAQIHSGKM